MVAHALMIIIILLMIIFQAWLCSIGAYLALIPAFLVTFHRFNWYMNKVFWRE